MSDLKNRRSDETATSNSIEKNSLSEANPSSSEATTKHECSEKCHCHAHHHLHAEDNSSSQLDEIGACSCCGHDHNSHINRPLFFAMLTLAIIICIVAMLCEHQKLPWLAANNAIWLFVVAYLIAGRSVLLNALRHLIKGDLFNEFSLMTSDGALQHW
ncbi:MAG: hypothetical protein RRY34_02845 [Victivallaceae bacterium]